MTLNLHHDAKIFANRRDLLNQSYECRMHDVAEIGVAYGEFSIAIIDTLLPLKFHAIDTFDLHTHKTMWGQPIFNTLKGETHLDYYRDKLPKAVTHQGSSWVILADFDDNSLDFAYLDADHSYESVTKDLEQLHRIIRPGGYLMLDDYTNWDPIIGEPYGVLQATNEFLEQTQWPILGISLEYNGFHNLLIHRPQ